MALEGTPQQGRPTASARAAAQQLGVNYRTVKRMITDEELAGGCERRGATNRWYVYRDQLPHSAPPGPLPTALVATGDAEMAALRLEVADLRARLVSANEANRLLRMSLETSDAAAAHYRAATQDLQEAGAGYEQVIASYKRSAHGFQASADNYRQVAANHREALGQFTIPGHLEDI